MLPEHHYLRRMANLGLPIKMAFKMVFVCDHLWPTLAYYGII